MVQVHPNLVVTSVMKLSRFKCKYHRVCQQSFCDESLSTIIFQISELNSLLYRKNLYESIESINLSKTSSAYSPKIAQKKAKKCNKVTTSNNKDELVPLVAQKQSNLLKPVPITIREEAKQIDLPYDLWKP